MLATSVFLPTALTILVVASTTGGVFPLNCGALTGGRRLHKRIVNGQKADPHQWPWTVSLQSSGAHVCGGVLIAAQWVLTAAHCVMDGKAVRVVLGAHKLDARSTQLATVARPTLHPRFANFSGIQYDIALLRLQKAVPFTEHIKPICLPREADAWHEGDAVWAAGWGSHVSKWTLIDHLRRSTNGSVTRDDYQLFVGRIMARLVPLPPQSPLYDALYNHELRHVELQMLNASTCLQHYTRYRVYLLDACRNGRMDPVWCNITGYVVTSSRERALVPLPETQMLQMLCAGPTDPAARQSLCQGDSGGPLMRRRADGRWMVVGMTSIVEVDCITHAPELPELGTFFASVSSARLWIDRSTTETSTSETFQLTPRRSTVALMLIVVVLVFGHHV